jgi:ATP synthase I chain
MSDEPFFERASGRIEKWIAILTFAGALACLFLRGVEWAGGFLAGAAVSYLNFRWLKKLVNAMGRESGHCGTRSAVLLGGRYLLLGIAGYAIVSFSTLSLAAGFLGLFVPVAAVIVEILYELIYAGT